VRNAEHGCFVMQALLQPVAVNSHTRLNGRPLRVGEPSTG
jgi:hypothetical protein